MAHFDERSGVVECPTDFGSWHQTMEEVVVSVTALPEGTRAKDLKVAIAATSLSIAHAASSFSISGKLLHSIMVDDSTWTVERSKDEGTVLRITLTKSARTAESTWPSLMVDQYAADSSQFDDMEKKATLERFARENPGMDFSGAEITGNYKGGGPKIDAN